MDVLVTGGTGFIGQHLCDRLQAAGHDVTALARDPDPDDVPEGVSVAMGDVTALDSIRDAFEGMDAVYNLVSLSPLFEPSGGNEQHDRVHRRGTKHCVEAAEEHEVDRFIQMSGLGADPDGPTHFLRAKGRAEQIVRDSSLSYTIFQPSVVFGEGAEFLSFTKKLTPPLIAPLPGGGKTRFQPIHVDDLTAMLVDALDQRHAGETYEIGGPEVLTLAKVAKLVRTASGQPVRILPIPMPLAGLGLRFGDFVPGFPMGSDQYRSLQIDNTTADNDIDAFGYDTADLRTLSEYLEGTD
jgi:NADH dehydrogenase